MGSVRALTTTGDNDPEIFPVDYYRYYLYCDACGSFDLEHWMSPAHWMSIEKTRKRLGLAAVIALSAAAVAAWFFSDVVSPWLVLLAGLTVCVGLVVVREVLSQKIRFIGFRCRRCAATCPNGSPSLYANPRSFTIADVPRPLGSSQYLRGESVEGEGGPPAPVPS
jgi:hypothetical protein